MPTFIQGAQGKVVGGTSASAAFGSNNAAGNLLVLAICYYDNLTINHSSVGFTVTDTHGNVYTPGFSRIYPSGGVQVDIYYCLSCGAGANTINVVSAHSGVVFLAAHEVAPDAGQAFTVDRSGNGVATATNSVTALTSNPVQYNNEYLFGAIGFDNVTYNPTAAYPGSSAPFTARQYIANNVPQNAYSPPFYGALSTYDAVANISGAQAQFQGVWGPTNVFTCVAGILTFVSKVPSCDVPVATPGTGTYTGTQSVTLTQAQSKPMYYTVDGTTPTTASTLYSGTISVAVSTTLKVLAHDPGAVLADSFGSFFYTITVPPPANSTITITWQRRTRYAGAWQDSLGDVPLNEDSELYDLEIWDDAGAILIRSVALTSPTFVYTPAMQQADFGQFKEHVYVKVYQRSAQVGRGFPAINSNVGGGQGWHL